MKVTPVRSKRTADRRWPASVRCRHSSTSRTQAPASLPSSWNVNHSRLSCTVIRSMAHVLTRSLKSEGRASEANFAAAPRKVGISSELRIRWGEASWGEAAEVPPAESHPGGTAATRRALRGPGDAELFHLLL